MSSAWEQWSHVPRGARSGTSQTSQSTCVRTCQYRPNDGLRRRCLRLTNYTTDKPRPRECFDEVLALVLTSLEQPSTHPSSSLFEDNAAHDTKELCDAMHDWLNWKIVRHDISSQHVPDNLIEQASFTLGALNPGQRVAFVVYYGGTGSETHTLFLR